MWNNVEEEQWGSAAAVMTAKVEWEAVIHWCFHAWEFRCSEFETILGNIMRTYLRRQRKRGGWEARCGVAAQRKEKRRMSVWWVLNNSGVVLPCFPDVPSSCESIKESWVWREMTQWLFLQGPGFRSQHTNCSSQPSLYPVLGDQTPSCDFLKYWAHTWCNYICMSKIFIHIK